VLYLYALVRAKATLPEPGPGLEDVPTSWLVHSDMAALVTAFSSAAVPASSANVWRHEELVEAVMATQCVLPVRFGTVFTDEAALHAALALCYGQLVADLDRLQGRVEMAVRVLWEHGEETATESRPVSQVTAAGPMTGRAYMLARLQEEQHNTALRQQAEGVAQEIHQPLAHMAVDSQRRILVTPRLLLTAAYLIDQDKIQDFQQQVRLIGTERPELRLLCTGPWPAYSFVTAVVTQPRFADAFTEG